MFVVDQDAKGLLGRMVCAYGPVNKCLELSTFPSADPEEAFRQAAGKDHHTLIDAIWEYTQFMLDEETQKLLVVCSRSGLYRWLRMPFGPSPAPAHRQSYVAKVFGGLRDRNGEEFVSALMDDLKLSSVDFERHMEHLHQLCTEAEKRGFEFKAGKAQLNQAECEIWGMIGDAKGIRPQKKQLVQLEGWPVPVSYTHLTLPTKA